MKRTKLTPMTHSHLEMLPTKRLLARLDRLRQCEESFALSDRKPEEYPSSGIIEFKDSSEWIAEYQYLKELLSNRKHISRNK